MSHRDKFNNLPKYSFLISPAGGVQLVVDRCGNWIDRANAAEIVEIMDDEINHLNSVIRALKGDGIRAVKND